jgi:hypothetical protein
LTLHAVLASNNPNDAHFASRPSSYSARHAFLLKAAEYPDRGNPQTEKVANCLREAILELEISTDTTNDGQGSRV